jgi:hypothetical protein
VYENGGVYTSLSHSHTVLAKNYHLPDKRTVRLAHVGLSHHYLYTLSPSSRYFVVHDQRLAPNVHDDSFGLISIAISFLPSSALTTTAFQAGHVTHLVELSAHSFVSSSPPKPYRHFRVVVKEKTRPSRVFRFTHQIMGCTKTFIVYTYIVAFRRVATSLFVVQTESYRYLIVCNLIESRSVSHQTRPEPRQSVARSSRQHYDVSFSLHNQSLR